MEDFSIKNKKRVKPMFYHFGLISTPPYQSPLLKIKKCKICPAVFNNKDNMNKPLFYRFGLFTTPSYPSVKFEIKKIKKNDLSSNLHTTTSKNKSKFYDLGLFSRMVSFF